MYNILTISGLCIPSYSDRRKKESNFTPGPLFREPYSFRTEKRYGHEIVYGGGLRIYTTLDKTSSELMEKVITEKMKSNPSFSEASGLSMEPATGFVKASGCKKAVLRFWNEVNSTELHKPKEPRDRVLNR